MSGGTDGDEVKASEDVEDSVTVSELIESTREEMDEFKSIFGAADFNHCTFEKGYLFRQALYSCETCRESTGEVMGMCVACANKCHADHDIIELFTKRSMRCDCGNSRSSIRCKLTPDKGLENEQNSYESHNFSGKYCTCDRPYPDPEAGEDVDEEMWQCVICEDWFHRLHLKMSDSELLSDKTGELICFICANRNHFVHFYGKASMDDEVMSEILPSCDKEKTDVTDLGCVLEQLKSRYVIDNFEKSMIVNEKWREALCKCSACRSLYATNNVEFLLSPLDSLAYYESLSANKSASDVELDYAMSQINNIDSHATRLNVLNGLSDFRNSIAEVIEAKVRKAREEDSATNGGATGDDESRKRSLVLTVEDVEEMMRIIAAKRHHQSNQ